ALPKGSTELQEELNKIIKKLSDEGKIDEFIKKNHELAEQTATE
ncbi:MAG: amino acid ABC transporter substrate-binding protein, partial [Enterococcus faecium]|nr:amino acid ABC transporter substrate-binding protein [Enterococcus faecium]